MSQSAEETRAEPAGGVGSELLDSVQETGPSNARVRRLTSPSELKPSSIAQLATLARSHHFETACITLGDHATLLGVHDVRGTFRARWRAGATEGALLAESGRQKRHVNVTQLKAWLADG